MAAKKRKLHLQQLEAREVPAVLVNNQLIEVWGQRDTGFDPAFGASEITQAHYGISVVDPTTGAERVVYTFPDTDGIPEDLYARAEGYSGSVPEPGIAAATDGATVYLAISPAGAGGGDDGHPSLIAVDLATGARRTVVAELPGTVDGTAAEFGFTAQSLHLVGGQLLWGNKVLMAATNPATGAADEYGQGWYRINPATGAVATLAIDSHLTSSTVLPDGGLIRAVHDEFTVKIVRTEIGTGASTTLATLSASIAAVQPSPNGNLMVLLPATELASLQMRELDGKTGAELSRSDVVAGEVLFRNIVVNGVSYEVKSEGTRLLYRPKNAPTAGFRTLADHPGNSDVIGTKGDDVYLSWENGYSGTVFSKVNMKTGVETVLLNSPTYDMMPGVKVARYAADNAFLTSAGAVVQLNDVREGAFGLDLSFSHPKTTVLLKADAAHPQGVEVRQYNWAGVADLTAAINTTAVPPVVVPPTVPPSIPPVVPPVEPPPPPPVVPPVVPPTSPPVVPPTVPPTSPPTVPPTVPPTSPPVVPPTVPPVVPPTSPPVVPPTVPPVVPPTSPPVVPPVVVSPPTVPAVYTTTVTISKIAPRMGEPVTLTAKVTAANGAVPAGSVTFTDNGVVIGTAAVNAAGNAVLADVRLRLGARKITATFAPTGNPVVTGSAAPPLYVTVSKAASATALTAGMPGGGKQMLEARVTTPSGTAAIGTVKFTNGATVLGEVKLDGNGVARLLITSGTYSLRATYSGSSTVDGSQSAVVPTGGTISPPVVPPTVPPTTPKATTVALAVAKTSVVAGDPINLRATVTTTAAGGVSVQFLPPTYPGGMPPVIPPVPGTPVPPVPPVVPPAPTPVTSGQVKFYDGSTLLGTINVGSNGQANLSTSTKVLGNHDFKAVFVGTAAAQAGTSAVVTVAVAKPPSRVAFVTPPKPTPAGLPTSVQVKVSAPLGGSPVGTVAAFVNGQPAGTAAVNGNGLATLGFPTGLAAGMKLRFEYGGSSVFDKSTVEASV